MTPDVPLRPFPPDILWPVLASALLPRAPQILTVCLTRQEVMALPPHVRTPGTTLRRTRFAHLRRSDLRGPHAPRLILSPLLSHGFDCMDLLTTLREVGFAGRYLVLATRVPDISLIRAEMQARSDGLNVDIVALDAGRGLHLV